LYETDPERQLELLKELLCREVFNCEPENVKNGQILGGGDNNDRVTSTSK
jgi:hypothetical protein